MKNTMTQPLATVTFTASNGIAMESYKAMNWNEYHTLCQTMERLGWTKTAERFHA